MAEVVRWVFEQELKRYSELREQLHIGTRISDWPLLLWEVLSQPSGLAVLEILQAARSDPALAEHVGPVQDEIERASARSVRERLGLPEDNVAAVRLLVWAIRGLTIGQVLVPNPAEMRDSVELFRKILEKAAPGGDIRELE